MAAAKLCIHGHKMVKANTYTRPSGVKQCRTCRKFQEIARRLVKQARKAPDVCLAIKCRNKALLSDHGYCDVHEARYIGVIERRTQASRQPQLTFLSYVVTLPKRIKSTWKNR